MTDEAGAAPAAAEPVSAPSADAPQGDAPAPAERSKEPARASIDRAFAALEGSNSAGASPAAKETKEKPFEAAPATEGRDRDEHGRFKAKEASPSEAAPVAAQPEAKASAEKPAATAYEPPARFSADAKATWKDAPPAVQAEVTRAIKEMEGGLNEYKALVAPLKNHFDLAKKHNTTVHDALDGYLNVERALRGGDVQQKLTAIEGIFETAGISPRDYAAHIMGQKPDQVASQNDQTIRSLRAEIAELKQQFGGINQSIQERQRSDVEKTVKDFAEANPRMKDEAFAANVAELLRTGYAKDLSDAYDKANRLNPLPVEAPQPASTAAPTQKPAPVQTRTLSIGGAPTGGSNPSLRKPAATRGEALDRAFASVGLT